MNDYKIFKSIMESVSEIPSDEKLPTTNKDAGNEMVADVNDQCEMEVLESDAIKPEDHDEDNLKTNHDDAVDMCYDIDNGQDHVVTESDNPSDKLKKLQELLSDENRYYMAMGSEDTVTPWDNDIEVVNGKVVITGNIDSGVGIGAVKVTLSPEEFFKYYDVIDENNKVVEL